MKYSRFALLLQLSFIFSFCWKQHFCHLLKSLPEKIRKCVFLLFYPPNFCGWSTKSKCHPFKYWCFGPFFDLNWSVCHDLDGLSSLPEDDLQRWTCNSASSVVIRSQCSHWQCFCVVNNRRCCFGRRVWGQICSVFGSFGLKWAVALSCMLIQRERWQTALSVEQCSLLPFVFEKQDLVWSRKRVFVCSYVHNSPLKTHWRGTKPEKSPRLFCAPHCFRDIMQHFIRK